MPKMHEGETPLPGLSSCGLSWQKSLLVPCGDGVLEVLQVQAPGKKAMAASAFANGLGARDGRLFVRLASP